MFELDFVVITLICYSILALIRDSNLTLEKYGADISSSSFKLLTCLSNDIRIPIYLN